jgi:hypothetical protein
LVQSDADRGDAVQRAPFLRGFSRFLAIRRLARFTRQKCRSMQSATVLARAVRRISTGYDLRGLHDKVTSYANVVMYTVEAGTRKQGSIIAGIGRRTMLAHEERVGPAATRCVSHSRCQFSFLIAITRKRERGEVSRDLPFRDSSRSDGSTIRACLFSRRDRPQEEQRARPEAEDGAGGVDGK